MDIVIDTREKPQELERIIPQIQAEGVHVIKNKLYVGDYQSLDNARLVVERKKDLNELCGNVCQQHEKFKRELLRAIESNIKIVILCEHGNGITCLEDVYFWENPRKHKVVWKTVNGRKVKTVLSEKAVDGIQLYRSLSTIHDRYNVDFVFCEKENTGREIVRILSGE